MRQFLAQDHREFIRHGIVQMTQGSVDDELAGRMIDRFPGGEWLELVWDSLNTERSRSASCCEAYGGPLLLAQHVGCLSFTDEGFDGRGRCFPGRAHAGASRRRRAAAPSSPTALRDFCESHG